MKKFGTNTRAGVWGRQPQSGVQGAEPPEKRGVGAEPHIKTQAGVWEGQPLKGYTGGAPQKEKSPQHKTGKNVEAAEPYSSS